MIDENILKQARELIGSSKRVIIALPTYPTRDACVCAFALFRFLTKQGLNPVIVCSGTVPVSLNFFGDSDKVKQQIEDGLGLKIVVDSKDAKLDSLKYEITENEVHIFLNAKDGRFNPALVRAEKLSGKYDLVIVIGAAGLDDLGSVYNQNTDIFFGSPVLNIDTSPYNERFGSVNLVSLTYTSIAEVVKVLIESIDTDGIDAEIATRLLAGIVARTQSFQDVRTTPAAFLAAAELVEKNARHQDVIQHLFKTKPLPLLQLWGRALARLKVNGDPSVLCSNVNLQDLEKTGYEKSGLPLRLVLEELLENVSGFKVICLLVERPEGTLVFIAFNPSLNPKQIMQVVGQEDVAIEHFGFYSLLEFNLPGQSFEQVEERLSKAVHASI